MQRRDLLASGKAGIVCLEGRRGDPWEGHGAGGDGGFDHHRWEWICTDAITTTTTENADDAD